MNMRSSSHLPLASTSKSNELKLLVISSYLAARSAVDAFLPVLREARTPLRPMMRMIASDESGSARSRGTRGSRRSEHIVSPSGSMLDATRNDAVGSCSPRSILHGAAREILKPTASGSATRPSAFPQPASMRFRRRSAPCIAFSNAGRVSFASPARRPFHSFAIIADIHNEQSN